VLQQVRPDARCPKCGDPLGFAKDQPRYRSDEVLGRRPEEWLEWECATCWYKIRTPTVDADEKG
jgi:hypothetical protein